MAKNRNPQLQNSLTWLKEWSQAHTSSISDGDLSRHISIVLEEFNGRKRPVHHGHDNLKEELQRGDSSDKEHIAALGKKLAETETRMRERHSQLELTHNDLQLDLENTHSPLG